MTCELNACHWFNPADKCLVFKWENGEMTGSLFTSFKPWCTGSPEICRLSKKLWMDGSDQVFRVSTIYSLNIVVSCIPSANCLLVLMFII